MFLSLAATAAQPEAKRDSLLTILKIKDPGVREKNLILYLRYYFGDMPDNRLNAAKIETNQLLKTYHVANLAGINDFIETICQLRLMHYKEARNSLVTAISQAVKTDDHYLLYACFTHLGFLQTAEGNTIEAISSFRLAKQEATLLNDAYLQVLIDVNLSDIYYRNNLYSQSLFYIDQAQSLISARLVHEPRLRNALINNKAEVYFRMNNVDSVNKYNQILHKITTGSGLYIFRKRTDYYLELLHLNYLKAVNNIKKLQKDNLYIFEPIDELNLADAYFRANMLDSAKTVITHLLDGGTQNNHPEIKLHLYEVLGQIADKLNDKNAAASHFQMAVSQAKEQIGRLTQVDTISSQIKIDEIRSAYIQKSENYKRERLGLIFIVIVTVLLLAVGALLYWNIRRKKYYEKLLFEAKT